MYGLTWKRQLALAVALVSLGGVAVLYEYVYKPRQEDSEELARKLLPFDDAPVDIVHVAGGTGVAMRARCTSVETSLCKAGDQSAWTLEEPLKVAADKANLNSLLSTLKHLSTAEEVDLKTETAEKKARMLIEYGLSEEDRKDSKTRTVVVFLKDGRKFAVWFGNPHPIGDKIFAVAERDGKVDTDRIFLVPSHIKSTFDKEITHWRDKTLVTVAAHRVESFSLKNDHLEADVAKIKGGWDIQVKRGGTPGLYPGDLENVDALVTAANYLRAKSFASDAKMSAEGKAALAGLTPSVTVTFRFKKGEGADAKTPEPVTLTLYEKAGKNKAEPEKLLGIASNSDPVFELEPTAKGRLNKTLKELRITKLISSMERFGAKRIEFEGKPVGATPLALTLSSGEKGEIWTYASAPDSLKGKTPDDSIVQKALDQMSASRIRDFRDVVPPGEAGGLTVTVTGDDPAAARKWVLWKHDNRTFARDLKSPRKEAVVVDTLLSDALPWAVDFFDKKPPAPAASGKAPSEADALAHGADDGHGH